MGLVGHAAGGHAAGGACRWWGWWGMLLVGLVGHAAGGAGGACRRWACRMLNHQQLHQNDNCSFMTEQTTLVQ